MGREIGFALEIASTFGFCALLTESVGDASVRPAREDQWLNKACHVEGRHLADDKMMIADIVLDCDLTIDPSDDAVDDRIAACRQTMS